MQRKTVISLRKIIALAGILAIITVIGTTGFMLVEDEAPLDAFFMSIVLISTVGLGDAPATAAGKVLAVLLIAGGVGTLFYAFGTFIEFLVGGYLADLLEERSMKKKVSEISDHYLICGFGRVGRQVARELTRAGQRFVIIDNNPESIEHCREHGHLYVDGDAADDEILRLASIDRAKGLIACVDSDADNVFVTLSARVIAPDLRIVSRASSEESRKKLEKAGADRVVSPYAIGGREMATLMLKPMISDLMDVVTGGGEVELQVEQLCLPAHSPAAGRSIRELEVRQQTGAAILAVQKSGASFDTNPSPDTVLGENDTIIAVGTLAEIQALERLFQTRSSTATEK